MTELNANNNWKQALPSSVASPSITITAAMSHPVCSRVYTPPGTKLKATVHTEKRISTSHTNEASSTVRIGGQVDKRSSIIGQTDVVYMANNKPPTRDIGHTDVVYMANDKPPTRDIGHTDVAYMANNKPPTRDIGHTDVAYMANNKPPTHDIGHTLTWCTWPTISHLHTTSATHWRGVYGQQ